MRAVRLLLLSAVLLTACQPHPTDSPTADLPPARAVESWPLFDYEQAARAGRPVYALDTAESRIDVVVRRDGPLARFGHDHVISIREMQGFLLLDESGTAQRAELRFPVEMLAVDGTTERARYDLDTEPDADAIEGTRRNLMSHVLDAQQWPFATIEARHFDRRQEQLSAAVTIGINGSRYSGRHSFELSTSSGSATVSGSMVLRQTALGLEPFTALGGGLRVADEMEIHFQLRGKLRRDGQ